MKWDFGMELQNYFGKDFLHLDNEQIALIQDLGFDPSFEREYEPDNSKKKKSKLDFSLKNFEKGMSLHCSRFGVYESIYIHSPYIELSYSVVENKKPKGKVVNKKDHNVYFLLDDGSIYFYDSPSAEIVKNSHYDYDIEYFEQLGLKPDKVIRNYRYGLTNLLLIANAIVKMNLEKEEVKGRRR